jgi:hypothetical protein
MGKKNLEITGTGLKLIAVITMLIDHIGAGLLENMNPMTENIQLADAILRSIGRMAFPIYCYMLVEGFLHTRSVKKYGLRLLLIAIVSEVPFDYLFFGEWFTFRHNNVLWELLLGLIVLYCFSLGDKLNIDVRLIFLIRVAIMFTGMGIAKYTHLDYGAAGIGAISVMYYLRGEDTKKRLVAFGMGILMLFLMSSMLEAFAFVMLIPMYFYKGRRGADSVALRRFFYWFYPAHIFILGVISYCIL